MIQHQIIKRFLLLTCSLLVVLSGCEYDGPTSAWEEAKKQKNIIPVIKNVLPEDAGSASEITIIGEHFSPVPEGNVVYFDNVKAVIKSASNTEIVVFRPNIIGDSLTIKVSVKGAIALAEYFPYKLEAVLGPYGIFLDTDAIVAIAMDADENCYVILRDKSVIKLTPEGNRDESFQATASSFTTDMKMGPGGYLYVMRKKDQVYRIGPDGGNAEKFVKFSGKVKPKYFDFDENLNMYAGGKKTGLLLLRTDKSMKNMGLYEDYDILSIRVFDRYVYVAAEYLGDDVTIPAAGIWRNQILSANGDVGPNELVLDWANSGDFSESEINAITFSQDGDMYVATDHTSPILVVKPDGSIAPLFYGLISPSVDQFVWGNGNFLYANINRRTAIEDGGQLIRINMGKLSAPYYGR